MSLKTYSEQFKRDAVALYESTDGVSLKSTTPLGPVPVVLDPFGEPSPLRAARDPGGRDRPRTRPGGL